MCASAAQDSAHVGAPAAPARVPRLTRVPPPASHSMLQCGARSGLCSPACHVTRFQAMQATLTIALTRAAASTAVQRTPLPVSWPEDGRCGRQAAGKAEGRLVLGPAGRCQRLPNDAQMVHKCADGACKRWRRPALPGSRESGGKPPRQALSSRLPRSRSGWISKSKPVPARSSLHTESPAPSLALLAALGHG